MRERVGFIAAVERNDLTFAEICERFEISRKTGYKWRARYEAAPPRQHRIRAPSPSRSNAGAKLQGSRAELADSSALSASAPCSTAPSASPWTPSCRTAVSPC